jgi:hypothetical protein
MFKKSNQSSEQDLFKSVSQQMNGKKLRDLSDEQAWYNVFYREVTSQIDEEIFKPIYADKMGRPNSSIRILTSMIILKEGQNWTDEQLYENCRYNLIIMRALGLTNIDEEVPAPSTFYDFKSKLVNYYERHQINLFEALFSGVTSRQIEKYKINGTSIRMDSKLIQSNICTFTLLHKILQAFQTFYASLSPAQRVKKKRDREFIKELMSKPVHNHIYTMNSDDKSQCLRQLGFLIRKVLNIYQEKDSKYYTILKRMYEQYYEDQGISENPPQPKTDKQMEADSIQSIHDPDAAYRIKGRGETQQKVSGYSSNITETTKGPLNIITDVQVEKATYSDNQYLEKAAKNSEKITGQKIGQIHTDGGYDSRENRQRFKENIGAEWHLAKIKGGQEHIFKKYKNGTLHVYDPQTKKWLLATRTQLGKYRIKIDRMSYNYRYFTDQQVESMLALQEVLPTKINKGIRASAESTINQVFHTLNGAKSKYRGLMRHKIFVTSRCLWVNCQRIVGIVDINCPIYFKFRYWTNRLVEATYFSRTRYQINKANNSGFSVS